MSRGRPRGPRGGSVPPHGAVLVTGASSGLGRECALELEHRGFQVLAGVRREEDGEKLLAESHHERLRYAVIDITDDTSVRASAELVAHRYGGLRGLVNNAGICLPGPLECIDGEQFRRQLDVNVVGHLSMIRAHLPLLRRSHGRIVNVTSGLGSAAVPFLGAILRPSSPRRRSARPAARSGAHGVNCASPRRRRGSTPPISTSSAPPAASTRRRGAARPWTRPAASGRGPTSAERSATSPRRSTSC
ncbi:hypothetical protein SCALM49S_05225 [Streptomyces californicus]